MSLKQIWLNLPVHDVDASRAFYTQIGFSLNTHYGNSAHAASFLVGEHAIVLMLFNHQTFAGFVNVDVASVQYSNEVLFSLSADSRAAVDAMVEVVQQAGGTVFAQPQDNQGWMYGMGFADLDGHKWNMLYMDMDKMPR